MGYTYINLAFPSPLGFASTCRLPMISCRRCIPAADLFSNGTGFFNASTRLKSSSNPQTMVYLIILILRKPWNMVLNPDSMDACWRTVKRPPIQQSSSRFAQEPAMNPWFSHVFPMHFPCISHVFMENNPSNPHQRTRFAASMRCSDSTWRWVKILGAAGWLLAAAPLLGEVLWWDYPLVI